MKKRLYLAYGSNLNTGQMYFRCPGANPVGIGYIDDYELLFKGSKSGNYLTIEKKKGSKVPVGVWEVTKANERALDRYEGFPNFYYKKDIEIEYFNGEEIIKDQAFVYIMHEERKIGPPTDGYVKTCLVGYEDFGFDEKYLFDAVDKCR